MSKNRCANLSRVNFDATKFTWSWPAWSFSCISAWPKTYRLAGTGKPCNTSVGCSIMRLGEMFLLQGPWTCGWGRHERHPDIRPGPVAYLPVRMTSGHKPLDSAPDTPAGVFCMSRSIVDSEVVASDDVPEVTLWSGLDPERAIEALTSLYGPEASVAAAWCALGARSDGRQKDYRFWFDVFLRLRTLH